MKPQSFTTGGPSEVKTYDWQENLISSSSSALTAGSHVISCPATVTRGDRKRPNAWNYDVKHTQHAFGLGWSETGTKGTPSYTRSERRGYGVADNAPLPTAQGYSFGDPSNKALKKFYEHIRGDLDLSIDTLEVRQTSKMILDLQQNVKAIDREIKKLTHGVVPKWLARVRPVRAVTSISKLAAQYWLQYQYGVRPLMNTIYSLAEGQLVHALARQHFSAAATWKLERTVATRYSNNVPYVDEIFMSRRIKYGVTYQISDAERFILSKYTSLNPVSIAYELTPYSFVADWFVDIGGYLRAAESALAIGLQFIDGYKTDSIKQTVRRVYSGSGTVNFSTANWYAHTSSDHVSMVRAILSSMPKPRLPTWEPNLGSSRLLSAAALLRGLVR